MGYVIQGFWTYPHSVVKLNEQQSRLMQKALRDTKYERSTLNDEEPLENTPDRKSEETSLDLVMFYTSRFSSNTNCYFIFDMKSKKYHKTSFIQSYIEKGNRNVVSYQNKIFFDKYSFFEVLNFETMKTEKIQSKLNSIPSLTED